MTGWTFHNPVRLRFGKGVIEEIGVVRGGRPYLLVTHPDSPLRLWVDRIIDRCGPPRLILDQIAPNPSLAMLRGLCGQMRNEGADVEVIVALGDGSVMDSAKFLAAGHGHFDSVVEYLEAGIGLSRRALPIVAIPTTAGTGSDLTKWPASRKTICVATRRACSGDERLPRMSAGIVAVVLLAAVLHAGWNALLRAGADRLWSMTTMCMAVAVACAVLSPFVSLPARASWGYAILSALLHTGYNLFLVRTYRSGDLGQTYPISRGSSPVLVTIGAAIFAGEMPDSLSLIGVALVSGGIISLAIQGRKIDLASLPFALGTGCFIGAYSVTDGIGARLSGAPVGFTVWMSLMWGILAPLVYVIVRERTTLFRKPFETIVAAAGGIVSLIAYDIVVYAMSRGAMGAVSAVRETSVVFAALIGRAFLHERLTAGRITACVVWQQARFASAIDEPACQLHHSILRRGRCYSAAAGRRGARDPHCWRGAGRMQAWEAARSAKGGCAGSPNYMLPNCTVRPEQHGRGGGAAGIVARTVLGLTSSHRR